MKQDSKPVMSNTVDKHTPGPWRVTTGKHNETTEMWDKGEIWFNVNGEDGVIADVLHGRCLPCDEEEAEANAALIAAAPTLYRENKELKQRIYENEWALNELRQTRQAQDVIQSALERENKELREALQKCVAYLADLNGSQWIKADGIGETEMIRRAIELQITSYNTLNRK